MSKAMGYASSFPLTYLQQSILPPANVPQAPYCSVLTLCRFWLLSALFGVRSPSGPRQAGCWNSTTLAQVLQFAMLKVTQHWEREVLLSQKVRKGGAFSILKIRF